MLLKIFTHSCMFFLAICRKIFISLQLLEQNKALSLSPGIKSYKRLNYFVAFWNSKICLSDFFHTFSLYKFNGLISCMMQARTYTATVFHNSSSPPPNVLRCVGLLKSTKLRSNVKYFQKLCRFMKKCEEIILEELLSSSKYKIDHNMS